MADIELRMLAKDEASSTIDQLTKKLEGLSEAFLGFEGLKELTQIIGAAQNAMLELDNSFEQFGEKAGVAKEEMESFANTVVRTTTISKVSAIEGQAALLRYSSLTGDTFKRARDVMINLAATMGGDASQAANTLGRALERPETASRALRAAHIVLNAETQELIKNLVKNGQVADAQSIILKEFETRLVSAKDRAATLTGALTQLKNRFEALFEGEGAGTKELAASIKQLGDVLTSPESVEAFGAMVKILVNAATGLLWVISQIVEKATMLKNLALNADVRDPALVAREQAIKNMEERIRAIRKMPGDEFEKNPQWGSNSVLKQDLLIAAQEQLVKLRQKDNDILHDMLDAYDKIIKKGKDANDDKNRPTVHGGMAELQEITLDAYHNPLRRKIEDSPLQKMYDEWYKETRDSKTKILEEWADFNVKLNELLHPPGGIKSNMTEADAMKSRMEELDRILPPIEVHLQKLKMPIEQLSQISQRMTRDIEGAFTSMFENIGQAGFNLGQTMIAVFKKMFAEAAAHDLVHAMGLDRIQSKGASDSAIGSLFSAIKGMFTGGSNVASSTADAAAATEQATAATEQVTAATTQAAAATEFTAATTGFAASAVAMDGAAAAMVTAAGTMLVAAGTQAGTQAGGAIMDLAAAGVMMAAAGGFVTGPTIVGENGPELIMPGYMGATVTPNNRLSSMGSGGSVQYSPTTNISGTGLSAAELSIVLASNNDRQKAEMLRLMKRNGIGSITNG